MMCKIFILLITLQQAYNIQNSVSGFFNSIDKDNVRELRNWIEKGVKVDSIGRDQDSTGLIYSVKHKKLNAFKYLLFQGGADMNLRDAYGLSALDIAAQHGQAEMVMMLLQMGDNPFKQNSNKQEAIQFACQGYTQGHYDILDSFINFGVPISNLGDDESMKQNCDPIMVDYVKSKYLLKDEL